MNHTCQMLAIYSLQGEEGYRSRKYQCSRGFWTIGFGHNLDASGKQLVNCDLETAIELFNEDFQSAFKQAQRLPEWGMIDDVRRIVIINMIYQMGLGSVKEKTGVLGFTETRKHLARKDWTAASIEMLNSKYAQRDTPARAKRMSRLMKSGCILDLEIKPVSGFTPKNRQIRIDEINELLLA